MVSTYVHTQAHATILRAVIIEIIWETCYWKINSWKQLRKWTTFRVLFMTKNLHPVRNKRAAISHTETDHESSLDCIEISNQFKFIVIITLSFNNGTHINLIINYCFTALARWRLTNSVVTEWVMSFCIYNYFNFASLSRENHILVACTSQVLNNFVNKWDKIFAFLFPIFLIEQCTLNKETERK